jgi:hypothetical protein
MHRLLPQQLAGFTLVNVNRTRGNRVPRMKRWALPLALPFLLSLFGVAATPAAAANGDNLRQIILDRTGTACASVNPAGDHSSVGVGIAFNGVNLIASCYGDNTITENSPANGSLVAVHHIAGVTQLGALAWDNGRQLLWACGNNLTTIGTISLVTNVYTPVFNPVGGCFDGLAYDGADDTLWSGQDANNQIDHSTTAGLHLATFFPGLTRSGLAVGGSLLYIANNGGQQIYTAPKSLSSVTLFASFPRRIEDLECDNLTFAAQSKGAIWSIDAYDNIVNAWEIPFGSCLFGGGGNITLNPPSATNPAGTDHTVTAHVTDSASAPLAGQLVTFAVTGQNVGATGTCVPVTCMSDASGNVTFTYHDTNGAGTDTITASFTDSAQHLQSATATKTWEGAGPPASLTLTPETASNPVGTSHCLTATVTDANGTPVPNTVVTFTVTGPGATTGQATTDANGVAQFCYTGPALPGTDTITATATGGTSPSDTATKTWTIPANDTACKVNNGGRITAANGDMATFGGSAKGAGPKGSEEYQDHGSAVDINVHSINVLAVTCSRDGTQASIFGKATIDGAGSFDYRIDVKDLAEPGTTDTYRIRLSNGYDSGEKVLDGGNIQIH